MKLISGSGNRPDASVEQRDKILGMLERGKITAEEAGRLLDAIGAPSQAAAESAPANKPRFIRIAVNGADEKVDIRVPLGLLRAGIKLGAVIPQDARTRVEDKLSEKGISFNLSDLNERTVEDLIDSLSDLSLDVEDGDETVRIFCE
jgi:polyhydroxyalkanoate synthesis regulator phasin